MTLILWLVIVDSEYAHITLLLSFLLSISPEWITMGQQGALLQILHEAHFP